MGKLVIVVITVMDVEGFVEGFLKCLESPISRLLMLYELKGRDVVDKDHSVFDQCFVASGVIRPSTPPVGLHRDRVH